MKAIRTILLAGMALVSVASYAQKKLYIEDFELNPGETKELQVRIFCDEAWGGVQCRILAPTGITFEKVKGSRVATPITDDFDPDWMAFTQKVLTMDNEDTPTVDDTGALSFVAGGVQGDECPISEDLPIVLIKVKADDSYVYNSGQLRMYNMKISDAAGEKSFPLPDYYVATDVIETVAGEKAVKSVKYVNLLGVESDEPFQGVNVVVTTYEDGTKAAQKIVK